MTVGELIEKLSKYDKNLPVNVSAWESCMTDAGTDLGDYSEKTSLSIYDLETRIVIRGDY